MPYLFIYQNIQFTNYLFIDNETCVLYIFIEIIPVNDFHQVNLRAFRMYFSL